ncbi:MAG: DegT/DnrJ/EryC1/StrS family aminotransferase [Bacteroidales bacterium]|nr:DegT/DnrJ/EryC1/StrS family aminotransferase [Bacteroidales bacterium]
MNIPFLNLKPQHEKIKKEVFAKLNELYDRTEFAYGKTGKEFEQNFADFNKIKYTIAVDNGTSAIELCLRAVGIKRGDEIITVSNTFIATVAGIHFVGAKPVFVEVDNKTWNIDVLKIEENITEKTKAIIPVNLYGQPSDMINIQKIAKKYNLVVINDAAQSIGSKILENEQWKSTSEFSDLSTFSFYAGKNLGACGEAGAIVTDNQKYAEYIAAFRDHGSKEKYIHEFVGKNNRIDAFQAAILNIKLKHINNWNEKRKKIANWYYEYLKDIDEIQLPFHPVWAYPVYHLFVILVNKREKFQKFLADNGIGTALHYKLPVHLQAAFKHLGYKKGEFPLTEAIVEKNVSLPMFPEITKEQVKYISKIIKQYFSNN